MSDTEADYRDDLGEMSGIDERPLRDFLPSPDQLVWREDTVKVTCSKLRASEHRALHAGLERQAVQPSDERLAPAGGG